MNIVFLALFLLLFSSCGKNKTEEMWAAEEARLLEWIKENRPDAVSSNGIYFYKIGQQYPDNIQPDVELRDNVLVDFICRFLDDDAVEVVSYKGWWPNQAQSPSMFREGGPELWTHDRWSIMGIGELRENERANVYVPSRLLELQDFRTRVYTIHLRRRVNPDILAYQERLMSSFMERSFGEAIDTITITDNGKDYHVMYHVVNEGSGSEVEQPGTITTKTSEYYFMEDDDFRLCFNDKVLNGFNGGVSRFNSKLSEVFVNMPAMNNVPVKRGSKIIAVMPYRIMYADLNRDNGQYIAPLSSVLKYEILIDN